ncbi:MAG: hypothetical protein E3J52_03435 [Promethearchaeota archaeon]|nr:MAG: hypothetical protein E3J52_03435 [Candidatus Lokiarchaeota archaeon]
MKKIGKASLVLLVFSVFLLGIGPTTVLGQRYHSDYEGASQKILTQIKSFTFSFDSTMLRYNIVFGARFIKTNDTSEFVSDVFVFTADDQYVQMLTATLTFDASFSYDGTWNNRSGSGYDSTSLFQYGDLLYSYGIHSFIITNDLFPLELEIIFEYEFTSSEFSVSGTYTVVKSFSLKSSGFKIPGYILSTTISILVVGILAIVMIYKRKKILKINNF